MALIEARDYVDDSWTEGEFMAKANAYFCEIGLQSSESISPLIELNILLMADFHGVAFHVTFQKPKQMRSGWFR